MSSERFQQTLKELWRIHMLELEGVRREAAGLYARGCVAGRGGEASSSLPHIDGVDPKSSNAGSLKTHAGVDQDGSTKNHGSEPVGLASILGNLPKSSQEMSTTNSASVQSSLASPLGSSAFSKEFSNASQKTNPIWINAELQKDAATLNRNATDGWTTIQRCNSAIRHSGKGEWGEEFSVDVRGDPLKIRARIGQSVVLQEAYETVFRGEEKDLRRSSNCMEKLVRNMKFELFFAGLIVLNTVVIALEVQYNGLQIGYDLKVPGFTETAETTLPHVESIFPVVNATFGILFTVECAFKMFGLRWRFFRSRWNIFDLFIVVSWLVTRFGHVHLVANPLLFRLCRLARLVRLLRLVRFMQAMDALHVLVTSIRGSLGILVWSCFVIMTMATLVSLFTHDFVATYLKNDSEPLANRRAVFEYFGTFTRCSYAFFEATLGNFAPVMRRLQENVNMTWGLFFIVYKMCGGFAVTSVILGVFLHETFRVADSDDHLMVIRQRRLKKHHLKKMSQLFHAADRSGTGALSYEDFKGILHDPYIRTWLAAYELDVADVRTLFNLIDDGDGRLTAGELIAGVSRLRGAARSIDLHMTMQDALKDLHEMKQVMHSITHMAQDMRPRSHQGLSSLPGIVEDLSFSFSEMDRAKGQPVRNNRPSGQSLAMREVVSPHQLDYGMALPPEMVNMRSNETTSSVEKSSVHEPDKGMVHVAPSTVNLAGMMKI